MTSEDLRLGQRVRVTHEIKAGDRSFCSGYYQSAGGQVVHEPRGEQKLDDRVLWRIPLKEPVVGIIVGYTFRISARYHFGYEGPGWLEKQRFHKVWMVAHRLRYKLPTLALERDVEADDETHT